MDKLIVPCSYQGGKQRLAKQIVDIILTNKDINKNTKFYDLCCGSGAISLELINRGINPKYIIMVDKSPWGVFWEKIGNGTFDINLFENYINDIPKDITKIKDYAKNMLKEPSNNILLDDMVYKFLILQSCAFGGTATWVENNKWKKAGGLRNYWLPTEKSNRKSPVNPMMPMPNSLFNRVKMISNKAYGVTGKYCDVEDIDIEKNSIVYIDPPYKGTQDYGFNFNYDKFIDRYKGFTDIYISEGFSMNNSNEHILLSQGRSKGNINGNLKKKPTEEWLNVFYKNN